MRCNAQMDNFMASVNQTRLQLEQRSAHNPISPHLQVPIRLGSPGLWPAAAAAASGQPNLSAMWQAQNNLRQLLSNSLACSIGDGCANQCTYVPPNFSWHCCCCCPIFDVTRLVEQVILATCCSVAQHRTVPVQSSPAQDLVSVTVSSQPLNTRKHVQSMLRGSTKCHQQPPASQNAELVDNVWTAQSRKESAPNSAIKQSVESGAEPKS